jgi:hypothetical protein
LLAGLILNDVHRARRTDHPSLATVFDANFYFGPKLLRFLSIADFGAAASPHAARLISWLAL